MPGDFVHVPAFTVHRESNPTDEPSVAVIARAGGGIPTVNVDPPLGSYENRTQEVLMRFRSLRLGLAVAMLGLALPLLSPAVPASATTDRVVLPTLTSVQAQHVGNVDRVTFGFANGLPADVFVDWVDTLHRDGSGLPVRVAGTKVLMVVFNGATAHDQNGATVRTRTAYALPNVITSVGAGDFEGTVTFGLGVQKRTSYTVTKLQNPDRVVVDVSAGFPTTKRKVWLVDSNAVETGDEPVLRPPHAAGPQRRSGRRRAACAVRRADPAGAVDGAAAGALPAPGGSTTCRSPRASPGSG